MRHGGKVSENARPFTVGAVREVGRCYDWSEHPIEGAAMTTLSVSNDAESLRQLARELGGSPVPGLRMSEREFEAWDTDGVRAEWVDGEVILMAPASMGHVGLNGWLWRLIGDFVEHRELGEVFGIEAQVRLSAIPSRRNPDLFFVAQRRLQIVKRTYLEGPPDLVIEIVSPDSESRDWRDKFLEYERAGVREYWIFDLESKQMEAYSLPSRGRAAKKYRRLKEVDGRIDSKVLRGFYLSSSWVFRSPRPKVAVVLKELGVP
jgi:Uma2 family endonuclease